MDNNIILNDFVKFIYTKPEEDSDKLEINIEKIEPDEEMEELYDYKDYLEKT